MRSVYDVKHDAESKKRDQKGKLSGSYPDVTGTNQISFGETVWVHWDDHDEPDEGRGSFHTALVTSSFHVAKVDGRREPVVDLTFWNDAETETDSKVYPVSQFGLHHVTLAKPR